jgi:type IV pilus assembly protein PilV
MKTHRYQQGATLIEVLIATLVLAIGLLGIGATLMVSMQNSQGALERSQAVAQTYSILDVLRENKPDAIIGRYNMNSWTCTAPAGDSKIGADLNGWITSLKEQIGSDACGRIVCNSLSCTVSVRWGRWIGAQGEENQEMSVVTRL